MAWDNLKQLIRDNVYENHNEEISGQKLQNVLIAIVDRLTLGGYAFKGYATPLTISTPTDGKVAYFGGEGTYDFGITIAPNELALLLYDGSWSKQTLASGISQELLDKLVALPTNAELQTILSAKANIDGYYESMGVGYAKNLLGNGRGVLGEFSFRPSGGTADIGTGIASLDEIRGNSVVWNQLVNESGFYPSYTISGIEIKINGDEITLNGTAEANIARNVYHNFVQISGHKYFCILTGNRSDLSFISANHGGFYGNITNSGIIINCTADGSSQIFQLKISSGVQFNNYKFHFLISDLTLMGIADKITTPEDFTALYGSGYKEYNPGTAISFKGEGLKTIGVNQWDEQWEVGSISATTGALITDSTRIRPKNYIKVKPSTQYCFLIVSAEKSASYVIYYDENHNYVSYTACSWTSSVHARTFTTPANCAYVKFANESALDYGNVYKNDIQIALYHSGGEIPTTYHPYEEHTLALPITTAKASGVTIFPDGARSAGTAYDNFHTIVNGAFTKATKRIGVVDLGSRLYTYQNNEITTVSAITDAAAATGSTDTIVRVLCAKFVAVSINDRSEAIGARCYIDASKVLHFRDSGITSAAAFRVAMAGVLLFYELATPVDYTLDEPIPVNYNVNDWGTEMLLPQGVDENGVPKTTPIIASIVYAPNVVDAIRNLPKNFASIAASGSPSTINNLLTALKNAGKISNFTITWDSTNNVYNFTIS